VTNRAGTERARNSSKAEASPRFLHRGLQKPELITDGFCLLSVSLLAAPLVQERLTRLAREAPFGRDLVVDDVEGLKQCGQPKGVAD
jgi:hypothetical protein